MSITLSHWNEITHTLSQSRIRIYKYEQKLSQQICVTPTSALSVTAVKTIILRSLLMWLWFMASIQYHVHVYTIHKAGMAIYPSEWELQTLLQLD